MSKSDYVDWLRRLLTAHQETLDLFATSSSSEVQRSIVNPRREKMERTYKELALVETLPAGTDWDRRKAEYEATFQ